MKTEEATRVVPAGWYQDPSSPGHVRWWNGISWTEHVEVKPTPEVIDEHLTSARALEREVGISTAESEIITRAATGQVPAGHPRTGTIAIVGAPPAAIARTGTMAGWLLAFAPLFAFAFALVGAYVYFFLSPTPLVAIIGVLFYLLAFLWAIADSRTLISRGHAVASPLWALALPVVGPLLYLINRRRRAPGSGPLVTFLILLAVSVGLPVAALATDNAGVITKAFQVQHTVRSDLVGSGAVQSVTCPAILESTNSGTIFTCDAVLPDGRATHVWVSFDDDNGAFSWALANR